MGEFYNLQKRIGNGTRHISNLWHRAKVPINERLSTNLNNSKLLHIKKPHGGYCMWTIRLLCCSCETLLRNVQDVLIDFPFDC